MLFFRGEAFANNFVAVEKQGYMLHNKTIEDLLQIKEIYLAPDVRNYIRGQEILAKYPDAALTEVPSYWNIPELHGNHGSIED